MNSSWLQTIVDPLPEALSDFLIQKLRELSPDVHQNIVHRANLILEIIFKTIPTIQFDERHSASETMDWLEKSKSQSLKLYYRILSSMFLSEIQRIGNKNLTPLITNERFHRCMLLCSVEIIFFNYFPHKLLFPHIIDLVAVTPFDMGKATEGFAKYEQTLPSEVKRHLNYCDENILQFLAWKTGSSLYNALIFANKKLTSEILLQKLLPEPMLSLDQLKYFHLNSSSKDKLLHSQPKSNESSSPSNSSPTMHPSQSKTNQFILNTEENTPHANTVSSIPSVSSSSPSFSYLTSPSKTPHHPHLLSAFASPQGVSINGFENNKAAEIQIKVFFEKVLKLSAIRIRWIWERIRHPSSSTSSSSPSTTPLLDHQMYFVFHYALNKQTDMFFNRHVDQIILCCIYGVCKVNQLTVTFKDIISHYRKQSQCKTENFRNVIIKHSTDASSPPVTGDIIRFYNEVFVLKVKTFLLKVGNILPSSSSSSPSSPPPPLPSSLESNGNSIPSETPSSLPFLPYSSPKRISSHHNVYVSPLHSSKKEALLSPNTQKLVASIGEENNNLLSTSKYLAEINSCLTANRLGKIKFGDVVFSQNGNEKNSEKNQNSFENNLQRDDTSPSDLNQSNSGTSNAGSVWVKPITSVPNPAKRFRFQR